MRTTRPIDTLLKVETYKAEPPVEYSIVGGGSGDDSPIEPVKIPVSIAYRIYFLARAFDGQVIRQIEPRSSALVDYANLQRLASELDVVAQAVSDPVTQHYLAQLLPLCRSSTRRPGSSLRVLAPSARV
jgi:hypothetical protein